MIKDSIFCLFTDWATVCNIVLAQKVYKDVFNVRDAYWARWYCAVQKKEGGFAFDIWSWIKEELKAENNSKKLDCTTFYSDCLIILKQPELYAVRIKRWKKNVYIYIYIHPHIADFQGSYK